MFALKFSPDESDFLVISFMSTKYFSFGRIDGLIDPTTYTAVCLFQVTSLISIQSEVDHER